MAYVEVDEIKLYLNISGDDEDVLIDMANTAAQKWFETKTKRVFEASTNTTRYFDARRECDGGNVSDDYRTLYLDHDLCSINTITNGDGTTVSSSECVTDPRNFSPWYAITLKLNSTIAWTYDDTPENAIAISGKWAWSTTPPDDVKQAVKRLAGYLHKQRDNWQDLDRVVFSQTGAVMLPPGFPRDVADVALLYWRRGLG